MEEVEGPGLAYIGSVTVHENGEARIQGADTRGAKEGYIYSG